VHGLLRRAFASFRLQGFAVATKHGVIRVTVCPCGLQEQVQEFVAFFAMHGFFSTLTVKGFLGMGRHLVLAIPLSETQERGQ
jgi:hypothetical protein